MACFTNWLRGSALPTVQRNSCHASNLSQSLRPSVLLRDLQLVSSTSNSANSPSFYSLYRSCLPVPICARISYRQPLSGGGLVCLSHCTECLAFQQYTTYYIEFKYYSQSIFWLWIILARLQNCEKRPLVCLSVCPFASKQLVWHWTDFHEIWYLSIFGNCWESSSLIKIWQY